MNPEESGAGAAGLRAFAAEIGGDDFNGVTHLVQARSGALADSVGKSFSASHSQPAMSLPSFLLSGGIKVVGRDDCAARMTQISRAFNVSRVQDISDSISNPVGWFDAT